MALLYGRLQSACFLSTLIPLEDMLLPLSSQQIKAERVPLACAFIHPWPVSCAAATLALKSGENVRQSRCYSK